MEGVPAAFREFTVVFLAEGKELASFTCSYGDSLERSQIPQIPEKEDCYGTWPEFDYDFITESRVLEARYEPWISSLDSEEKNAEGRPRVLVQGQFLPGVRLALTDRPEGTQVEAVYGFADNEAADGEAAESKNAGRTGAYTEPLRVRVFSEDPENTLVEIFENGAYHFEEASVMGSYLEFSMENAGIFRLTEAPQDSKLEVIMIICGAGAAAVIGCAVAGLCKKRRKKDR